ncbi:MAG: hypothetical protein R3E32_15040 [Chitinophagales bacterium]
MRYLERIFDDEGKLTKEGRIIYAHAMHLSKVDDLPEELIEYVWKEDESREDIEDLYELLIPSMVLENPHPFFLQTSMNPSLVSIDWTNLEAAMEDILRQALAEQTTPNRKMERKMALSFKATNLDMEVIRPKKDAVCVQSITFVFSQATAKSYWIHFKNAKGGDIEEMEVPKGSHEFQISIEDKLQFPTGLYYWTILVNGTPMTNRLYVCTEESAREMLSSH